MVSKLQLTSELLEIASRDISQSYDRWTDYLTSAARMYKYPFKDQVLIYAQRPDATACMELEMWNDRMRRWITAGSKGIALIDESGQKPHLRYVYDVSDTREGIRARKVNIWQIRQEHYGDVIKSLENIYGQTTDKMKAAHDLTFATQLMEIADRAVEDSDNDYFRVLMEVKQDSHLDYLQAKEIRDILRKTIIASVQYVLLSRCGLDAGKYLSADNFREVPSFNTAATLSCLGRSVTDISCTLLREVERSVKKYDKEKAAKTLAKTDDLSYTEFSDLKRERSSENGRVDIQPERGLLGSESGIGRYDGGHREIRESAQDLPERKQQHTLRRDVTDGQVVAASSGDKPDGTGANRQDATTDDGERGSNRSPESVQSNGMGALGEQSARFSGGNRVDGVGIQLDLFPSVQEQIEQIAFAEGEKSSAFSMSAEDINSVLLKGSDKSQGKFRIYEHFQSRPTVKESIKYLKNEYGTGGNTHIFPDGSKGYVNRDRRGIGITKDRIEIMNPDKPLSWATVENQIRDLILTGRYLASEELEKYNQWQKERQAAIMEALKTGFERPAAKLQVPKKKDDDFEQLTFGSLAAATTSPPKTVDLPLGEQTAQESENVKSVDEIFEAHYPVVINRVLSDAAYQNACKYSDKQNAGIQLEKTISHILITFIPGNLDFYRMYMDVPGIKQRLYDLVFQETYPALSGMIEDAQDHGEQDVQRPPDNARKTSGAVSSDQNAEDAPPPATLPQEQITVDYLIGYGEQEAADNEFVDSYGVAGKVFSELKDTGRNPLTWFDSEYANSYTPRQAEEIRGLINTALQNTYPVAIPVPITSTEWERIGKGYKKSEYRDGGKAIMLAVRSGLEMMPAVIDDDNGLEIQRFAFKAGGRNEVVSAYTEKHALEVIESYGFYLDEISELKGYPLWPITSREWDGIGSDYRTEEPDGTRFILKDGTLQPIIIDDERGHELQKFTYDESGITYICLAYTEQEALSIIETNGHNIRLVENLRSESARTNPPVQEKQAAPRSESPAYQFEIRPDVDTRDNSPMFVAKVLTQLSKSDFQVLKKDMGKIDGHYSRFKHGFIFRGSDPTEKINRHFNLAGSIDAENSTQNAEASQETEKQQHIGEKQRSNIDGTFTGELTEYASIQSKYPGAIIALQDGNTYKFYGDNAKSVRLILDRKIISRTMPDGSIINMTRFPVERESELRNLLEQSGNRAVIAAKDAPEATYYIKHEINITIDAEIDNSVTGQTEGNKESLQQETVTVSTGRSYNVGDTVYLEKDKPYIITYIDSSIRLVDPSIAYPIQRSESRESFEQLLRKNPLNSHFAIRSEPPEYEYVVGHKVYLDNQPFYIRIIDDGYRISLDSADKSNLVSKQSLGIKDFENQLRNDPRNDYLIKAQKAKLFPELQQSENDSIDGKAHKQVTAIPERKPTTRDLGGGFIALQTQNNVYSKEETEAAILSIDPDLRAILADEAFFSESSKQRTARFLSKGILKHTAPDHFMRLYYRVHNEIKTSNGKNAIYRADTRGVFFSPNPESVSYNHRDSFYDNNAAIGNSPGGKFFTWEQITDAVLNLCEYRIDGFVAVPRSFQKESGQPIPDVIPTADSAGSRSRPEPDARTDGNSVTILPEQEDAQGSLADRGNTESVQTGAGIQNESSAVLAETKGGLHTPHVNTAVDSVRGRSRPEPDAGINSAEDTITHTSTNRHRQLNAAESELNASREAPILRSEIKAVDTQTEIPMLKRHNYHITDNELGVGAKKVKYTANVAAIRKLQEIEAENRLATPEEQEILSRYVGWGGIPQVFDPDNDKWTKEYAVLKSLISDEEYESARASTLNAHYTSPTVIKAMYDALERIGFKTGNILEPACGVGNFFGLVPESMTKSKLYGVELDSITGRLAKQLYQEANITVSGFEDTNFPDNFFDLAVGNVPFGEYRLSDKRYDKQNFLIHDYFFAKALDKVRPGGIVAFISSKGTLDKQNPAVRKYIADRADLLGAVRLPNNAFKQNAGTEVTTDILFFQKRDRIPETEPEWVNIGTTENGIPINNYYLEHPEMVLGTMAWDSSMYGNETETACMPVPDADLSQQLAEAVQNIRLPDMDALEADELLNEVEAPDAPANESIPADPNVRNYSYTLVDGKLYYRENSNMNFVDAGKKPAERIRGMIELRDCTRTLIEMQLNDADSTEIEAEQARLSTLYDQFRKKHGLINSDGNKNAFKQDSSYPLLCSLEVLDENRNFERKADMFTKRTIQRHRAVTSVDTASEALAVSIGERACVDLGYMASLMGGSEKIPDVVRDLQGVIFKDPETGPFDFESNTWYTGWQAADEYLSGDVRKKLESARKAAETYPEFAVNVEALEKIQPKDLTASEIDVQIGATWIAPEYYRQFMFETFQTPEHIRGKFIDVLYSPFTGEWNIKGKSADSSDNVRVYSKFGIKRRNAYQIFEDCLNLRDSMVYDKKVVDGKEKRVLNGDLTTVAQEKQEAMKEAFKAWLWKDPERRAVLCEKYNKTYNATRPREYDGSHINFVGMNPEKKLRPHQLNAVAHMMYGKNTLLAHCVGAGKTYEMVAAAMESKRLGLCKKSLIVVPNHLTGQWGSEFLQLYPGAKVLVARKQDFEPQNRKKFCARIATGDYDAVIIGHTQFEKIPLSAERQKETIHEQINEIIDGIREAKSQNSERYTIKQMEKSKKTLEARLRRLNDVSRKDDVVTFEELGVDRLFVDEAHYYKNLFTYTKMRNVAGIGQSEAQKSSDMLAKCRYIDELTGGRGVTFATGTPISNSMVELYTMMRYLQYDTLQEKGYKHFDSWAAAYGQKVTAIELNPEGTGFRAKTRFARFVNLPELMSLWKEAADIQTADMLDLPVPEAEYITVKAKPSDHQKAMVKQLSKRANAVRKRKVKPHQDNMLTITNDGRKLALDQRLYDDLLPDDPESKLNLCVQNVFDEWRDTTDIKGTQLVFCDLSTPKPEKAEKEKDSEEPVEAEKTDETEQDEEADEANTGEYVDDSESINFSVYQDIKNKLMAQGIPANEIAFIHDAKTDTQKTELFAKVRNGQVRVLIGSTQKMGAGTNVQDKMTALHHLDCPWRPSDLEQREGRILRQGNDNKTVKIFRYVTEGTFDAYSWGIVENKRKYIGQVVTSKSPARSVEDVDATALSYAEVKALATGDPRIKEKMDLDIQVSKLKMLKANHDGQRYELQDKLIKYFPREIKKVEAYIAGLEADDKILAAHPAKDNDFSMNVLEQTYTERKEAGAAIIRACTELMTDPDATVNIGEYRGFPMKLSVDFIKKTFILKLKQNLSYSVELGMDEIGNVARISNELSKIQSDLKYYSNRLNDLNKQMENAREEAEQPFPQEQEFAEKSARLSLLNAELSKEDRDDLNEHEEETETDDKKESVLKMLKKYGASIPAPSGMADRERDEAI